MIFSFSRLNLYEQCPFRFYQKYVLQRDEAVTLPLALGKAVHKAIESEIRGKARDQAIMNGFIESDFHEELTYKDISDLVEKAPIKKDMGETEVHFKLSLSSEKNAPMLQGYIDVVQPKGSIVDWKTNRIPYDVRESYQVALYAWAISKIKSINTVRGSYYFLRFSRESSYLFTDNEMNEARKWAINLANDINEKMDLYHFFPEKYKDIFPAKPSRFCKHCPFSMVCYRDFKLN
ncbi:PD-(D/E)XK nuclease family protein [Oceanobacillus oncorhynchi]|uniref:PD-(D/E)XK nuclease family protein n=1 Tax=Oceanobacillus oncorhynchi TaxID=545501 RepID=UPI0018693D78|nr:PD-(D/E)XK nuclease family protein [Oceanobacillus oncorhynchi]